MGRTLEAKEEVVEAGVADVGVSSEACVHGFEVDGTMMLVDLDGVSTAEGDLGAVLARGVGEDALVADRAARARSCSVDLGAGVEPEVVGEQGAAHEVRLASEEFEGFGDLDGGGQVDGGGEDAGGVAGFDRAGWGTGEEAGEAGCSWSL